MEAWRVHHSLAFQLEYLQTINRDIQALVRYALTSPEKLFDAPSIQSLTKGRGSNNKTETDSGNQVLELSLDFFNKIVALKNTCNFW